jgi:hypothetical protein
MARYRSPAAKDFVRNYRRRKPNRGPGRTLFDRTEPFLIEDEEQSVEVTEYFRSPTYSTTRRIDHPDQPELLIDDKL